MTTLTRDKMLIARDSCFAEIGNKQNSVEHTFLQNISFLLFNTEMYWKHSNFGFFVIHKMTYFDTSRVSGIISSAPYYKSRSYQIIHF